MKRRLVSLLFVAGLAQADFSASHFRWRRLITIPPGASLTEVVLDSAAYRASSEQLADLRVVRDGVEAPYDLALSVPVHAKQEFAPKVLNQAAVPGRGVEAVLDLEQRGMHNRLRVASDLQNFQAHVQIEASDDEKRWTVVLPDGIISDLRQGDARAALLTLPYPDSTRRYLRVTISGWTDPARLTGVWVSQEVERTGVRDVVARVAPVAVESREQQTSQWTFDLGGKGMPHDQAALTVGPGLFRRDVEVSSSVDGREWRFYSNAVIWRTARDENGTVTFPEQWDRYLRMVVHNADNAPLHAGEADISAYRRTVRFASAQAGQYWLYSGDPRAKAVSYDLGETANLEHASLGELGLEQPNPAYAAPQEAEKPWTERHLRILYGALGVAVVAMGSVAIRFLLKTPQSSD